MNTSFIKNLKYNKKWILFWINAYDKSLNKKHEFFKVINAIKKLWRKRWVLEINSNIYYFKIQDINFRKLNTIKSYKKIVNKVFKRYLLIKYANED